MDWLVVDRFIEEDGDPTEQIVLGLHQVIAFKASDMGTSVLLAMMGWIEITWPYDEFFHTITDSSMSETNEVCRALDQVEDAIRECACGC